MPYITKELATAIAKKLGAKFRQSKAHDIALIYHNQKLVCQFGIRRGSSKDSGHDYIPGQIFVKPREAKLLGQCPLKFEDWIRIVGQKGKL